MKAVTLLLLTALTCFAATQEPAKQSTAETETAVFSRVERVGEESLRSFFMFSAGGHDYTIRADGRGERSFEKARSRNFTLRVDQGHLEQVWFLEHEGDLFLAYQLSGRSTPGYVIRFNQTTLRTIWIRPVADMQIETAVLESGYINLKKTNAVVKLDLKSGAAVED